MIRTFLFDLGNVLVNFCHERMCAQIGALCQREAAEVQALLIDSGLQLKFERGTVTEEEFQAELEQLVDCRLAKDELYRAGSDIFQLNESILPVLDSLKSSGHRLVLLSNTSAPHIRFVRENFDVLERFDDFVLSFEVGAVKPDARIFAAALAKIDCPPSECFYTDDIEEYVQAGRKHGLQAEQFVGTDSFIKQVSGRGIDFSTFANG